METWRENELYAFEKYKELFYHMEPVYHGGSNANRPDIETPFYNIEVKSIKSQCGQDMVCEECADPMEWIKDYYKAKNVKKFIFADKEKDFFTIIDIDDLHLFCRASYTIREKSSGSRRLPNKDVEKIGLELRLKDGKYYVDDSIESHSFEIDGEKFFVNKLKEVRKCSRTRNRTRVFSIEYVGGMGEL